MARKGRASREKQMEKPEWNFWIFSDLEIKGNLFSVGCNLCIQNPGLILFFLAALRASYYIGCQFVQKMSLREEVIAPGEAGQFLESGSRRRWHLGVGDH